MKRLAVLLLAGALVALMLQPVSPTVNKPFDNLVATDGVPPPPFPGILVATDGVPPPPFPGQPVPDSAASGGWLS
jgi:hypothetical protein